MPISFPSSVARVATIDPVKVVDPINLDNIHVLIQSILCGEHPASIGHHDLEIIFETSDQWRTRIEGYAAELEREIYSLNT